mgnify:CR=1 FL=1
MKSNYPSGGNDRGKGHGGRKQGNTGYCKCPQCGYSEKHQAGVPCKSVYCPDCKISLERKENTMQENKDQTAIPQEVKISGEDKRVLFPQVIPENCTACGACIDVCPAATIVLRDGKAFVINDFCRNCRICLRVCRFNAFKLA